MKNKSKFDAMRAAVDGDRLAFAIREKQLSEDEAMDLLQDVGIVSCGAVKLEDVAVSDRDRAAEWLEKNG